MENVNVTGLEPNSHKYKNEMASQERQPKEKAKPMVKRDQIVSTKKPLSKRITDTLLGEDLKSFKKWFLQDFIVPGIGNFILDGISMVFFKEADRGRSSRRRSDDRYDYKSCYKSSSSSRRRRESRRDRYESDDQVDIRNIVLRNRDDAENVIEELRSRIRRNDSVSVAELLDLLDVPGQYTDNNWGWDDERDIGIRRVSSGYLIDVAEPRYLD